MRPEGYSNPFTGRIQTLPPMSKADRDLILPRLHQQQKAFEDGADAYEKALKKKGARLEGHNIQTPAGSKLPISQLPIGQADIPFILKTNLGKGWLVFIPEEEPSAPTE